MPKRSDRRERSAVQQLVDSRAYLIVGGFVVLGAAFLVASEHPDLEPNLPWAAAIAAQLGGLFLATGALTVAWELLGKRAFADEIWSKAELAGDLKKSGITKVTDQYLEEPRWNDFFRDARRIDIVVAYANTWRNMHSDRIEAACRNGARVRVFLPDPGDSVTMENLARRFKTNAAEVERRVREAALEFAEIGVTTSNPVQVFKRPGDLVFSCYKFDSTVVLTLYSHSQQRRGSVPTFVATEGSLVKFASDDVDAIEAQSTPF